MEGIIFHKHMCVCVMYMCGECVCVCMCECTCVWIHMCVHVFVQQPILREIATFFLSQVFAIGVSSVYVK